MAREWTQDEIDAHNDMFDDCDDEHDDDDWNELMCSMGNDGQCGQAGSEFCDFECPIMAGVRAADRARAARKAKRT